jgi:hypothetical protein
VPALPDVIGAGLAQGSQLILAPVLWKLSGFIRPDRVVRFGWQDRWRVAKRDPADGRRSVLCKVGETARTAR